MLLLRLAKGRKDILFTLLVPLLGPLGRAEGKVGSLELLTGDKVLSLGFRAFKIVDIVLPAVLGLIPAFGEGVSTSLSRLERGIGDDTRVISFLLWPCVDTACHSTHKRHT